MKIHDHSSNMKIFAKLRLKRQKFVHFLQTWKIIESTFQFSPICVTFNHRRCIHLPLLLILKSREKVWCKCCWSNRELLWSNFHTRNMVLLKWIELPLVKYRDTRSLNTILIIMLYEIENSPWCILPYYSRDQFVSLVTRSRSSRDWF